MSNNFEEIWKDFRIFLQKHGVRNISSESIAKLTLISSGQISRLRSKKISLTDKLIGKIVEVAEKHDEKYSENLRRTLEELQAHQIQNKLNESQTSRIFAEDPTDAIQRIEELFDRLANAKKALLCVEFRDLPKAGVMPRFAELASEAVRKGLCLGMFQPFGLWEKLLEMEALYLKESLDITKTPREIEIANMRKLAYVELSSIANTVRSVYKDILRHLKNGEHKGSVVLYEAERKSASLTAVGVQSRLFYTRYQTKDKDWESKVYDWVYSQRDTGFFVERNVSEVSREIVRAQFHPISTTWGFDNKYKLLINEGSETSLDTASRLMNKDRDVQWKNWTP